MLRGGPIHLTNAAAWNFTVSVPMIGPSTKSMTDIRYDAPDRGASAGQYDKTCARGDGTRPRSSKETG